MRRIKESAGNYTVMNHLEPSIFCTVLRNYEIPGLDKWLVLCSWDKYQVTDPLRTKAEAVAIAEIWVSARLAKQID